MTSREEREHGPDDPNGPILHRDVGKRLDAIIRRFGGKPRPIESIGNRVVLPAPKRGHRKGQMPPALGLPGYRKADDAGGES